MDLHQRLQLAASQSAIFEYKHMILPKGEAQDLIPKHDQSHLLSHSWESLSSEQQSKLADQLKAMFPVSLPPSADGHLGVTNIFHESLKMSSTLPARYEAPHPEEDIIDVAHLSQEERSRIENYGIEALAEGKGAVLVLAGGSGTRLGMSFPKGMLVCPDTVAPRSLFQWHCERISGMQRLFKQKHAAASAASAASSSSATSAASAGSETKGEKKIPLVIMLSPQNEEATQTFFKENKNFGLDADQVFFFTQSCMPCFNPNGKVVLAAPGSVSMAPGGNAGIYPAIYQSGVLKKLTDLGVELVQVVTVDNILGVVADPILFGSAVHKEKDSAGTGRFITSYTDVVAKTCPKLHDKEAVGVFARRVYPQDTDVENCKLRWGVLEYSELGPEVCSKKRPVPHEDQRLFDAGNIAVHLFSTKFLAAAAEHMLNDFSYYHVAKKPVATSIPLDQREKIYGENYMQGAGWSSPSETSTPAIKLEAFIFDLFQFAETFKLLNVVRTEEFSAIKNADDQNLGTSSFVAISKALEAAESASHISGHDAASAIAASMTSPSQIKKDSPQTAIHDLHALHSKWFVDRFYSVGEGKEEKEEEEEEKRKAELAQLVNKYNLRVEFSPLAIPSSSALSTKNHKLVLAEDTLEKTKKICESGRAAVLVLFANDSGTLSAIDMAHGRQSSL